MADIHDMPTQLSFKQATTPDVKTNTHLTPRIALGAIALLSIFMNFFLLGQNGYGNLYYASGVRSMTDNWHNFFFVSFDPGGFVTIDKPAFGFWLQTLSTKLFGFTPFSIFLPQAVCGVLAVLLLYVLVRRHFGVTAGLVAALALAVTPISVVTNRNNTIDGTLALALLLAAWAVIHAAETGKLRWLLLSAVFVGIGFNIKMAEAYLVVPALVITYLLCAPRTIWTRIWHLLVALLVMLVISLSWAIAVDMTPTAQRPYVGSTQTNSEVSLATGYNGLNRLHIGSNQRGAFPQRNQDNTTSADARNTRNATPPTQGDAPFQIGTLDPLHLFSPSLGGQIAWLLPFALLAIVAVAWQKKRFDFQHDRQQLGLMLWGFWLLTMAIFFTLDSNFHQYYMTEMAPGLNALVGIGLVVMWRDYRSNNWRGWLLPIALFITGLAQLYLLHSYPTYERWLSPIIITLTALAVLALAFFRLKQQPLLTVSPSRLAYMAAGAGLLALLIAPTLWAGYSVIHNTESSFPIAGPNAQGSFAGFFGGTNATSRNGNTRTNRNTTTRRQGGGNFAGFGGGSTQNNAALISYLETNQGHAKYLLATASSNTADSIILATNRPVMAMGGFSGNDAILTLSDLQSMIQSGTVRFFLINAPRTAQNQGRNAGFGGSRQNGSLTNWIGNHCSVVPPSSWQTTRKSTSNNQNGATQLYDCSSTH
jgi:4-amino-4-deoxy-L-arabinose transferase-like glycosyltransferase